MTEIILAPRAATLSQSMRDLGYSLETAIADLIDNSITAAATQVDILFTDSNFADSNVAIIDNGTGMSEAELLEAMRPGSRSPREKRASDDLGRFGLGLKTASFSQCRSLTVVSQKKGKVFGARWDLDLIEKRDEWVVTLLGKKEIDQLPFFDELGTRGTYILWQKPDRLIEGNVNEKFYLVEKHLALVFHRYLSGDYKKQKLLIRINGHSIVSFDPFCVSNKATQMLAEEIVRIQGHEIRIQPYILPHHTKLSKQEFEFYRDRSDFVSNQGVYVYRNGRLMSWGNWFGLTAKSEATKLARVRIDFSNALDELWTIDIKKSRAHPPRQVLDRLRLIVNQIGDQSKRIHLGRGNRILGEQKIPVWARYADRNGTRYSINRSHPLIAALNEQLTSDSVRGFDGVLSVMEQSLPLAAIYADYSNAPQSLEQKPEISYEELKEHLYHLRSLLSSMDVPQFARLITGLKPFSDNLNATQRVLEEMA